MKKLINQFIKKPRGMAMIIVLTVVFVVLITVATGATIIVNNLNKSGGQAAKGKSEVSLSVALERLRGMYKADKALFKGCGVGDCVNTTASGCVACTDSSATYNNGDIKYQSSIFNITQPQGLTVGSAIIDTTGFYKNIRKQARTEVCLNYCDNNGFNCGDNGCGGNCGICTEPDTCGGGGASQVCGSSGANCSDVTLECDVSCPVGSTCGGGTIVDADKHIIVTPPGCDPNSVNGCPDPTSGTDTYSAAWDRSTNFDTGANDQSDGRNNSVLLNDIRYAAAKSCIDGNYNAFTDWYLPSSGELGILDSSYQGGYGIGYDLNNCYWASSQHETDPRKTAYIHGFDPLSLACSQPSATKGSKLFVRCIRRYGGQALATCSDPNTECTADCQNGDQCGGGTVVDSTNKIVASFAGCNGVDSCDGVSDSLAGEWDNSGATDFTTAQDSDDGRKNMVSLINGDPKYVAAIYCDTPIYYGFDDWYLPANNEIGTINQAYGQGWTSGYQEGCYWSSTETNFKADAAYKVGMGSANGNCNEGGGAPKGESNYIRCLRRYK